MGAGVSSNGTLFLWLSVQPEPITYMSETLLIISKYQGSLLGLGLHSLEATFIT